MDLQEVSLRTELYEDFLFSMTLQLSDGIIVVMNDEITYQNQMFLHSVIEKWSGLCREDGSRIKKIIVIHNFRFTENVEERDRLFAVRNI